MSSNSSNKLTIQWPGWLNDHQLLTPIDAEYYLDENSYQTLVLKKVSSLFGQIVEGSVIKGDLIYYTSKYRERPIGKNTKGPFASIKEAWCHCTFTYLNNKHFVCSLRSQVAVHNLSRTELLVACSLVDMNMSLTSRIGKKPKYKRLDLKYLSLVAAIQSKREDDDYNDYYDELNSV
jgi:hypothetical protein